MGGCGQQDPSPAEGGVLCGRTFLLKKKQNGNIHFSNERPRGAKTHVTRKYIAAM